MDNDITKQGLLFKGLLKTGVVARFDHEHASSDGGAVLLKACDERLGIGAAIATCFQDGRRQAKVDHTYREIFQQRMFGITCEYADGNDAARIADDDSAPDENLNKAEILFWEDVRESGDPELLKLYIKKYPNGNFSDLAAID